jgi:hypothetical protein
MTDMLNQTGAATDPNSPVTQDPDMPVALCHRACPVCDVEISSYQSYCQKQAIPITWIDISNGKDAPILEHLNLDREDVKRRMTVVAPDGSVHRGVDAFLVLWRTMPRYRGLAWIISLPGLYPLSSAVYDWILAPLLYRWNVARGR